MDINITMIDIGLFALKTGNHAWPTHLTQAVDFQCLGLDRSAWAGAPRLGLHPNTPYCSCMSVETAERSIYFVLLQHRTPWVIKFPSGQKVKNELTFSVIFHHSM